MTTEIWSTYPLVFFSCCIATEVSDLWQPKFSCYIMTRVWLKFSQLVHLSYLFNLLHCNQGFGLLAIEISLTYPPLFFGSYITTKVLDHQWSRFNGVSMFFFQLLHYDQGFGLLVTKIQSCPPMCFKVIALQLGF